jgi:hypothetical protein
MEQERQLGPEPSDADTPPPRRRRGAAANTQEESTEGVRPGRPCHGCACKHGKGCAMQACVILHNRHQQLGSHRIMLSVGAESGESPSNPGARGLHDAPCSPG